MSLSRLEGAFRSVTKPEELVKVYVPLKQFGVRDDPQAFVFGKLHAPEPARVALVGEPGSGKSGAVLSALDGLERMEEHRFAAIHIKVGDPEVLGSGSTFLQHVLQTMSAAADGLEDGPDADELDRAAASSTTVNDSQQSVAGGLKAPVVSADVTLRRLFRSYEVPTGEAGAAKRLGEVLTDLREAGHLVVFVVDDTEKFTANAEGELDREAVANLFATALDGLCQLPGEFDVVVAVQPEFRREVEVVDEYLDRLGFARQQIPPLPADRTPPPLGELLARRLEVAGIEASLDELVSSEALAALDAIYRQLDHDLRKVLNQAGSAGRLANVDPEASRLEAHHVAEAQEEARGSL